MTREGYVRAVAGSLVLVSLGLSRLHSPYWLLVTVFVGLNLLQSAFSGFCPLETLLERAGVGAPPASPPGEARR